MILCVYIYIYLDMEVSSHGDIPKPPKVLNFSIETRGDLGIHFKNLPWPASLGAWPLDSLSTFNLDSKSWFAKRWGFSHCSNGGNLRISLANIVGNWD